ncbi:hypothetical protein VNN36_00455 [Lactococcus garvieae]|uniref:hypothetical protein n=1 Tax=Lactococcus garvieae TaxID=1363 RepID=UPI0030CDBFD0
MKKIALLSTNLLLLLLLCACSSETIKSPDVVESTNYITSDYSSNESEENDETGNGDHDYWTNVKYLDIK